MSLTEHDEFLLSQLLDGELSPAETDSLRARIAGEAGLQKAFEAMRHVDRMLVAQRSRQPQIDFAALRREIMTEVHASSRSRVIRFPRWRWVAGSLAAAAAIALVFVLHSVDHRSTVMTIARYPTEQTSPIAPGNSVNLVEPNGHQSASQTGTLLVQFNRPSHGESPATLSTVSYARSDQQAKAMESRDEEYRSRPVIRMVMAQRAAGASNATPFDGPL